MKPTLRFFYMNFIAPFEQFMVRWVLAKKGTFVHRTTWIHPKADIGKDCYIGPYCYIGPNVFMREGNILEAHVSIGTQPEHAKYWKTKVDDLDGCGSFESRKVHIGRRNVFREYVTVQGGTTGETVIFNDCRFLRGSHVSHDTVIDDFVNVSCNVMIGGETYIQEGANLGLGAVVHQQQVIGAYSMLGMGTVVTKTQKIEPGMVFVGNPARKIRENHMGIKRAHEGRRDFEALCFNFKSSWNARIGRKLEGNK